MIIGHQRQWEFLKKSLLLKRPSHGYLFSGPEGLGKKTVALEFVKLVHCQNPEFSKRPCNSCPSCKTFSKGVHPDALFLTLNEGHKEIQIEQIRDYLIYNLSLKPFVSSFKTAIIDQAHLMSPEAQNCLLKTLEEPKGSTIIILVTAHPEVLSETVLSRMQEIKFFPLSENETLEFLKTQKVFGEKAKIILQASLGKPAKIIEFLRTPEKLEEESKQIQFFSKLLRSDIGTRFQYAKEISQKPQAEIFEIWLRYLRKVLFAKTKKLSGTVIPELDKYSLSEIKRIIEELETMNFLISTKNVNKRLALEILMLKI